MGGDSGTPEEGTLIHAILVSEKRIDSQPDLSACLGLALPEQLVVISPEQFRLRDSFNLTQFTYPQLVKSEYVPQLRSWLEKMEKGVHDLPCKSDIDLSGDAKRGHGLWPYIMSDWIGMISQEFATSKSYRRKWSVIDGPQVKEGFFGKPRRSKILVIGIYSTGTQQTG